MQLGCDCSLRVGVVLMAKMLNVNSTLPLAMPRNL